MARQRCIPFGYRMKQAAVVRDEAEAEAVKRIFTLYLEGSSLNQIAEEMTRRELRYHRDSAQWNKNMVKRILENRRYLGDAGYPQIISEELFLEAQRIKAEKNVYAPCPSSIAAVKDRLVCEKCNASLERWSLGKGRASWKCSDPGCRQIVHLCDDELIGKLERCMTALVSSVQVPEKRDPAPQMAGLELLRLENEMTAALNRKDEDADYIKALIFAAAAEKYKCLPEVSEHYKTVIIRERLEQERMNSQLMREIADARITSITIGKTGTLKMKLTDGSIITEEELEQWS